MKKMGTVACIGVLIIIGLSAGAAFAGEAALWVVDANDEYVSGITLGPYPGWTAVAYTELADGSRKRLVWRHDDGRIAIWQVDSAGNYLGGVQYGPYVGWTVEDYTHNGTTGVMILNNVNGTIAAWKLDGEDQYAGGAQYGPYVGWRGVSYSEQMDGSRKRVILENTDTKKIAIWEVDADWNYLGGTQYGPYVGWTVTDYWHNGTLGKMVLMKDDGMLALWTIDGNDAYSSGTQYGPYTDWKATAYHGTSGGGAASKMSDSPISNATIADVMGTLSLTVQKAGSGAGTITDGEQTCNEACKEMTITYVAGEQVDLEVTPAKGSYFAGWETADGTSLEGTYYATAGKTMFAVFELK